MKKLTIEEQIFNLRTIDFLEIYRYEEVYSTSKNRNGKKVTKELIGFRVFIGEENVHATYKYMLKTLKETYDTETELSIKAVNELINEIEKQFKGIIPIGTYHHERLNTLTSVKDKLESYLQRKTLNQKLQNKLPPKGDQIKKGKI